MTRKVFEQLDWIVLALFGLSMLRPIMVLAFYLCLLLYVQCGTAGTVKALFWLTVRGLISPAVGASIGGYAIVKWVLLLGFSVLTILNARMCRKDWNKLQHIRNNLLVFSLVAVLFSFLGGSYPIISTFKVISFALPFGAIFYGIAATYEYVDWKEYYVKVFGILFAVSFVLLPYSRFRITNNDFQGVFNHVNVFGILSALMIAMMLGKKSENAIKKMIYWIFIALIIFMEYQSASRTGMLSILLVLITYYLCATPSPIGAKMVALLVSVFAVLLIFQFMPDTAATIDDMTNEFIYKGHTNSIVASRAGLIDQAMEKFEASPIVGSGFMTPYFPRVFSYSFSFSLGVEPGNILFSLLGDVGILGMCFFVALLLSILKNGDLSRVYLFVGALAINMGEMVFFSSNNMSILVYMLLALYVFDDYERKAAAVHV